MALDGVGVAVHTLQRGQDAVPVGEDAVRQQERVEEVDAQEAEVGQALQEPVQAGVADLRHLAGVEDLAEANVVVVLEETCV